MCCLSIYQNPFGNVVFTHNRDEQVSRVGAEDRIYQLESFWMPVDPSSNGTWIATSGRLTASLLNGYQRKHDKKESYARSRGTIIPLLMQVGSIDAFVQKFDPHGYEPFTLLAYHHGRELVEFGWDETNFRIKTLDPTAAHFYASATLYSPRVVAERTLLFKSYLSAHSSAEQIWTLHRERGNDHRYFFNVVIDDQMETLAVSQIEVGRTTTFRYLSLNNSAEQIIKINNYETV